jgi:hypothetical protein
MKKKWYVVYKGKVPGVYDEWDDCFEQVSEFSAIATKDTREKRRRKLGTKTTGGRRPDEDLHLHPHLAHRDCSSTLFDPSLDVLCEVINLVLFIPRRITFHYFRVYLMCDELHVIYLTVVILVCELCC